MHEIRHLDKYEIMSDTFYRLRVMCRECVCEYICAELC
jgi:hypothetical protein